jgi:menaquinone-9 beta-reductase
MSLRPPAYDALIIGARCAGATLGIHLARAGRRVLMVDAAKVPSDQPMSTHFIQPFGMSLLDELGIGDKVRALAPEIPLILNGVDDAVARIRFPKGRGGSCLRRAELDGLLAEEARSAGVELRDRTRCVDLIRRHERVVGAVLESNGVREQVRAQFVVGADGRGSTVARCAGAAEYLGYDGPRAVYWAYFQRPRWYATDPRYEGGAVLVHQGEELLSIFPTNEDQLLVGCAFPLGQLSAWKGRHEQRYRERLRAHALTAPIADAEPLGKVLGVTKARYFFRQAAGAGWALVGDAGLHKDPSPGLGISDAFRDARALAQALLRGDAGALLQYWRERDVQSVELFEFAQQLGGAAYNNALNHVIFRRLAADPALHDRIVAIAERRIPPFAAFPAGEVLSWVVRALPRSRPGLLHDVFTAARRSSVVGRELARRKRLAAV